MSGANAIIGTLIVFDVILLTMLAVAAQTLRIRLSAVPDQATLLNQQLRNAVQDTEQLRLDGEEALRGLEELAKAIEERGNRLLEVQQRLDDADDRALGEAYIVEQLIQPSYHPWLIMVRRGDPTQTLSDPAQAEWAAGRRFIVYGEDAANARRRIETRFPPAQGYRAGDPQHYTMY